VKTYKKIHKQVLLVTCIIRFPFIYIAAWIIEVPVS